MEFDMKHVMNAIILGVVVWLLSWIFLGLLGPTNGAESSAGSIIWGLIKWAVVFGGTFYCFKDVKGVGNGLMTGVVYGVIFVILAIIVNLIKIAGWLPYMESVASVEKIGSMFGWPGIWLPLIAFLIFTAVIGWVNEQK